MLSGIKTETLGQLEKLTSGSGKLLCDLIKSGTVVPTERKGFEQPILFLCYVFVVTQVNRFCLREKVGKNMAVHLTQCLFDETAIG